VSTYEAIGGVSDTLLTLIRDRMDLPGGLEITDVDVTVGNPAVDGTANGAAAPQHPRLNIFLYRVTENANLKNQEPPGVGDRGAYGHPPLSLNLHYLLTAYGTTNDRDQPNETLAHFVLGSAMRVLHDFPVVTARLRTVRITPERRILHPSLIEQFETVKLYLEPLTLDDVSKIWTALNQPYRLSGPYMVSVVQIDSDRVRGFPRRVGQRGPRVHAYVTTTPRIAEITTRRLGDPGHVEHPQPYARVGDVLTIHGSGLAGERVRVLLGPVDASDQVTSVQPGRIAVAVPDHPDLRAGVQPVQVFHDVLVGEPPERRGGAASNTGVFVLVPRIDAFEFLTGPDRLRLTGRRLSDPDRESLAIIGDHVVVRRDRYTRMQDDDIVLRWPAELPSGTHHVRVRVGGAETLAAFEVTGP
jgi:hypothetical protein